MRTRAVLINDAYGRLTLVQSLLDQLRQDNIDGDWMECGTWRGGVSIFAAAYFNAYNYFDANRIVWLADSFEGVPVATWGQDVNNKQRANLAAHWRKGLALDGGVEQVRSHFDGFGFGAPHWGRDVRALVGYFNRTLPLWTTEYGRLRHIAYLRVDGDLYESTFQTLDALYPFVSDGGVIELDDYNNYVPQAVQAVNDYRRLHNITDAIEKTRHLGVY